MSKKNNLNYIPASAKTAAQKKDDAKQKQSRPSSGELSAEARKKLLKKRVWTLSVISLSLILVMTLSIIFATYQPTLYAEKPNTPPTLTEEDTLIKNQEFNLSRYIYNGLVPAQLQYPYLPDTWSLTNKNLNDSVAGIISRNEDEREKVIKGLKGAGITDDATINQLLAVESENNANLEVQDKDAENKDVMLFYNKTATDVRVYSNSFTVPTNGYLKITAKIRTNIISGDGAFIAFKTSASDSADAEQSFTRINTNGKWETYTFYIEGNKTSTKTIYLFVGLGQSGNPVEGWAEVDFAKAENTQKATYIEYADEDATKNDYIKTQSYVVDSKKDDFFYDFLGEGSGSSAYNMLNSSAAPITRVSDDELAKLKEAGLPFYGDPVIYGVTNNANSGVNGDYIKLAKRLQINQSTATPYYRLTFWAKTTDIQNNTGAYIYANVYDKDTNNALYAYTASFDQIKTSTSTTDVNSGWAEYSFLFQPDNTKPYEVEFIFSLGALKRNTDGSFSPAASDLKTTGSLYVTEFELKEIYQSEFNSATSGASIQKVSVSEGTDTGLITNGNFDSPVANAFTDDVSSVPTGYDPNGWSIRFPRTLGDGGYTYAPHTADDLIFGIVSKNASTADKQAYLGADYENYFKHTGSDNILATNIKKDTAVGFISNKFTLQANTYYLISFMVKTNSASNVNAYLTGDLEQAYKNIGLADDKYYVFEELTMGGYLQYNFVIKTGDKTKSVALELWVGNKDAEYKNGAWTGLASADTVVAFDNARTQTLTEAKFKDLVGDKQDGTNIFTKKETMGFVKDEDGNDTEEEEVVEVEYTTDRTNIWVRDLSYVDRDTSASSDDDDEDPTENPVAPIDWLLLSSLILSIAVIIFLVTMLVKKFNIGKRRVIIEDPDYKKD